MMSPPVSTAPQFLNASDRTLLIDWGGPIDLETHHHVARLLRWFEQNPVPGILNLHPAYCSLLVAFDPLRINHETLKQHVQHAIARLETVSLPAPRTVEIPVSYGGDAGPDLTDVAALHDLTPQQVIEIHSAATYIVYFLGFVPGFAYLGGLDASIATPRLTTPRRRVPAGSVAIGGNQTGVYPFETPGGWRLIGRTAVEMFSTQRDESSLLRIGDRVRFVPA
jgi:inhibitor of KinA